MGAGTVLTCAQVKAAADAGASFILSPSLDANVIQETLAHSLVSIPGVMTPTEAQNAMLWGADMVKIFPTGVLGISYLKAIRVPLNHIPMIAMGGANEENLKDFLPGVRRCGYRKRNLQPRSLRRKELFRNFPPCQSILHPTGVLTTNTAA